MTEQSDRKRFVHCAANMRVSAFVYRHRCFTGVPQATAEAALRQIWTPNETWQRFIQSVLMTGKEV